MTPSGHPMSQRKGDDPYSGAKKKPRPAGSQGGAFYARYVWSKSMFEIWADASESVINGTFRFLVNPVHGRRCHRVGLSGHGELGIRCGAAAAQSLTRKSSKRRNSSIPSVHRLAPLPAPLLAAVR